LPLPVAARLPEKSGPFLPPRVYGTGGGGSFRISITAPRRSKRR